MPAPFSCCDTLDRKVVSPNRLGAERLHKLPVLVAIIRGQA